MRLLTLVRYQGINLRRSPMLMFMPFMMLGMSVMFAIMLKNVPSMQDGAAYVIALCVSISTLVPGAFLAALSIAEEKEKRTLEALLLTPVKPAEWVGAHILTAGLMALIFMILSTLIFWRPLAAPSFLLLFLMLGAGWTIATGVLVGLVSSDIKVATGFIQVTVIVPFSLMGIPWEMIAPKVWTVLRFLPYRPALDLVRQAVFGGTAWVEPALVLSGWLAATVGLAIWQVRKRGFLR